MSAARERDDLALGHLLPAAGAAQAQLPFEHDQEFLALDVVVEGHLLARLELVQARTEVLGACPLGDASSRVLTTADTVPCPPTRCQRPKPHEMPALTT
jgi:hypothetical protein